ncbi:MAG: hypothetical protein A4E63_02562 [Syntrophorhabdus sp. PtaU1.Bin050]|nr:MAG: hypothetical protein A4E63_02562 [Syntrophorhabdus sp. PtaU1.Bin050]
MRIVEDSPKPAVSVEELLTLMQTRKQDESKAAGQAHVALWNLPLGAIILGALVIALGTMMIVLKSDITVLKNDMTELKSLRTQVAVMDPKQQLNAVETKMEEANRDREVLKGQLAQLQTELDGLKSERKKGKR